MRILIRCYRISCFLSKECCFPIIVRTGGLCFILSRFPAIPIARIKKKEKEKGIDRLSLAFELHEGAYCSSFREKTVEEWREKGKRRRHIILRGIKYKETWENENFNEHHVYHE